MSVSEKNYTNKIIIFLDILGIKAFTEESDDTTLVKLYTDISNLLENPSSEQIGSDYVISSLSDSIIISLNDTDIGHLPNVLRIPRIFQNLFLIKYGLLCRGYVCEGKIHHIPGNNIIFGQGLVKAAIEEENEDYSTIPVVRIDKNIITRYEKDYDEDSHWIKENVYTIKDSLSERKSKDQVGDPIISQYTGWVDYHNKLIMHDGTCDIYFLNQFYDLEGMVERFLKARISTSKSELQKKVASGLDEASSNNDISEEEKRKRMQKWEWVQNHLNQHINS